ncbi:hypothetical protein BD413DRAFT_612256 [Trametes elegans]|nr:hypothetical protein BD413DRAFT_612256 [Trametes elegans]
MFATPSLHPISAFGLNQKQTPRRITSSATTLPRAGPSSPLHAPFIDIFDVPARLGDSSALLRSSSAAHRPTVRRIPHRPPAPPVAHTLPAPVLFDGPARAQRDTPYAYTCCTFSARPAVRAESVQVSADAQIVRAHSLPGPKLFDGPSRPRPYIPGGAGARPRPRPAVLKAMVPLMLSGMCAGLLFGLD